MRRYTGKRYKKIFAGILAAALVVNSVPVTVRAGEMDADRSYTHLVDQSADNEETGDACLDEDTTADTASLWTNEDTSEDTQADTDQTTDEASVSTEDNESTEDTESADVTSEEAETTDASAIDTKNDQTGDIPDAESGDDIDVQSAADEVAVYAAEETDGTLSLAELQDSEYGANITVTANAITVTSAEAMILASNLKSDQYEGKNINIDLTGEVDLTETVSLNGTDYTYHEIGSKEHPYKGTLTSKASIKIDKTLFGVIDSSAKLSLTKGLGLIWKGTDNTQSIYARQYIFEEEKTYTLELSFANDTDASSEGEFIFGNLIGTASGENGVLQIKGLNYNQNNVTVNVQSSGNAGLICNTLQKGTIQLSGCTLPTAYKVTSTTGHAGGLVGEMEAGTKLEVNGPEANVTDLSVTASTGNAGGFVGQMADSSTLRIENTFSLSGDITASQGSAGGISGQMYRNNLIFDKNITLSGLRVCGYKYAGGISGKGENVAFIRNNTAQLILSSISVKETFTQEAYVGGAFGEYTESADDKEFPNWIILGDSDTNRIQLSTAGNKMNKDNSSVSGGLFGKLILKNSVLYRVHGSNLYVDRDIADVTGNGTGTAYGAISGIVESSDSNNELCALIINAIDDNSFAVNSKPNDKKKTYFHGGLVGKLGSNMYLEVKNVDITAWNPFANDTDRGFGGVVGRVCSDSVVRLDTISVETAGTLDKKIWEGGGIAGWVEDGSAIELNGTTDLSGAYFVPMYTVGLLVAYQENALIYARGDGNGNGWKYVRPQRGHILVDNNTDQGDLDDIGNYGQVIRLQADSTGVSEDGSDKSLDNSLIVIDPDTHKINLNQKNLPLNKVEDALQIPDKETFALLAIAIQSHGCFSAWSDQITKGNYNNVYNSNITLTGDIDLSGTGIYGLTRDDSSDSDFKYTGTFDGQSHKLTLAIGELYGLQGEQKVNEVGSAGEVCRHTYQGIFAATGTRANVKDLEIAGTIQINGMGGSRYNNDIRLTFYVGGFAGEVTGDLIVDNVILSETINMSAVSNVISLNAGGLAGAVTAKATIELGQDKAITANTTLDIISNKLTGPGKSVYNNIFAGGIIGSLSGGKDITVNCDDIILSGNISGSDATILPAGGLIGYSAYSVNTTRNTINIKKVAAKEQKIEAQKAEETGGILGYKWEDITVNFDPVDTGYALVVEDAGIAAGKAAVGGLVYRSSGQWTVADRGIDMQKASFEASNLGLLLCHMDIENNQNKALYLEFTSNWETAYKLGDEVSVTNSPVVFDEIAAYTAADSDKIMHNGTNGIISLETEDAKGVDTEQQCNTYVNRTQYGRKNKSNECSRYYYNLHSISSKFGNSGNVTSPERLLAWSIWTYVPYNLRNIMFSKCGFSGSTQIGSTSVANKAELDMKGISYYPVDVSGISLKNAVITFYNSQIEACETENKQTFKKSQHYMMHAGLFYDMTGSSTGEVSASVENITFAGTIGLTDSGSGVLCCGTIAGGANDSNYIYTLSLSSIVLDNLCVTGAGNNQYAPLLINKAGSYVTLGLSDISTTDAYASGTAAGSSLMGNIGTDKATQISVTFHKMILPDKGTDNGGIFTNATFMEFFQYSSSGVSSAVYNFNKEEDWKNQTHIHEVTYGKEIDGSIEYVDLQKHYYNKDTYTSDDGLVTDADGTHSFTGYLPYVRIAYNAEKNQHEIKVNQRINDLLDGCGTYGHPYIFKTSLDFTTVAEYIATKAAKQDWKIKVTADQTIYHTTDAADTDVIYQYDSASTEWKEVEDKSTEQNPDNWIEKVNGRTLSNDIMHLYILSAYYDVQSDASDNTVEVKDFIGFGTSTYPFRGVITSTKKPTATTVKLNGASKSLITYSYGSVVKNVNVKYGGTVTVTGSDSTVGVWKNDKICYQSEAFWGGIIGCVLGGDNIIDNVGFSMENDWKLVLDGEKNYLIQAGGYVGSITGGGVLFRHMQNKSGLTDAHVIAGTAAGLQTVKVSGAVTDTTIYTLYVNPFVGRVLDGYAFSEDCTVENGSKSYSVSRLDSSKTGEIKTIKSDSTYTTEISSAQGLLVFSAIVNSGGAAGAGTLAYYGTADKNNTTELSFGNGRYGKVRNADYGSIGKTVEEAETDFAIAVSDDSKVPVCKKSTEADLDTDINAPYLVSKYANGTTAYVCSQNAKVSIKLTNADNLYDMRSYGNGYQGISVRYISNALNNGTEAWDFSYGLLKLCGFEGNDSTIKVSMNLREYTDDDFHGASFGGVFNLLRTEASDSCGEGSDHYLVKNLNIDESNIEFKYINSDGTENVLSNGNQTWTDDQKNAGELCVSVGGFAGNTVQNGLKGSSIGIEKSASYLIEKFHIENSTVTGPYSAGGFMGATGLGDDEITAGMGYLYKVKNGQKTWNSFGVNLINCTYNNLTVTGGCLAGGFVGFVSSSSKDYAVSNRNVMSSFSITDETYSTVGQNSTIKALYLSIKKLETNNEMGVSAAGGIFGRIGVRLYINDKDFQIENVYSNSGKNLYQALFSNMTVNSKRDAGAVIGYAGANECKIYNVLVDRTDRDSKIEAFRHAGGVVGCVNTDQSVLLDQCIATKLEVIGGANGSAGILGGFENCKTAVQKVTNCKVDQVTAKANAQHCAVGGLIGNMKGAGSDAYFVVEGCSVTNSSIGDSNQTEWNGGLIGSMSNSNKQNLYVYDSVVKNTNISIGNAGGAGGLTCSANGKVYCSNILLDKISLTGSNTAAFVNYSGNDNILCADGISIKHCNKKNVVGDDDAFKFGSKSYIAFADYMNTAGPASAGNDNEILLDEDRVAEPYVVTSPISSLSVKDATPDLKYLHGDGASWTETAGKYKTLAQTIVEEKDSPLDGRFGYARMGDTVSSFDFANRISTYNDNQSVKASQNFPVLQISGGDVSSIADYLDILTNGGYSHSVRCNPAKKGETSHITATTVVYEYDAESQTFVKNDNKAPALSVIGSGTNQMSYKASRDFDNDQNRFTLLTVTWTSNVDSNISDAAHKYSIQVPVIVKRIMEIDFIATLGYGTRFRSTDYDAFADHILESFGNSMTGYLTYKYNSESGKPVEYGWNSYIESGGSITGLMDKKLKFSTGLPVGTQLTLVDCQDPNRTAYYYTVPDDSGAQISFHSFTRSDNGQAYSDETIGEALGAEVNPSDDGLFIEVDENGNPIGASESGSGSSEPTIKLNNKYYRLSENGEESYPHYTITVDETKTQENYYLVVTMPKTDSMPTVNGWLGTDIQVKVPYNLHYMLRDMKNEDKHSNTASTYQISDGYQQKLEETLGNVSNVKALNAADSTIKVSVRDAITFPNGQAYNVNDQLYQRFSGSLQTSVRAEDGTDSINYEPFPSGTSGKVRFYVYTLNGDTPTYYSYDEKQNKWDSGQSEKQTAVEYTWISTGGNMDLPLSTDGTVEHAISLQQLRDKIKTSSEIGTTTTFYVEAVLDAVIPASGLSVIPVSTLVDGVPQSYAKLNYVAQLSTEKTSLSYSSTKDTLTNTRVSYYQEDLKGAELIYDADDIDQLGINLLDLQTNLDKDQTNVIIGTTARLDLSAMQNLENVLRSSSGIRFKLTLSRKSTTQQETYEDPLEDASEYMTMKLVSPDSGTVSYKDGVWTWTIPASSYLEGDKLKTGVIFDGSAFTQAVNLLVNVENVEAAEHLYANYKVDLTAEILGTDGTVEISDTDNVIYTLTKIKPEFESK